MAIRTIQVKGACQNNLKNLDLEIPLNKITVVTGVSGSGKSSLAFDTLYAEGQRRYVETFSPYARQFMDRMDRPQVESIQGIPPAIAIDRKDPVRTSRSTVGTMTEITDYVKLLFARMGRLHCRKCEKSVVPETPELIWQRLKDFAQGSELVITYPIPSDHITPKEVRRSLARNGFDRIFFNDGIHFLEDLESDLIPSELNVVVDRVMLRPRDRSRILDSLEQAYRFGSDRLDIWVQPGGRLSFSNRLACARCNIDYSSPLPNLFSFNSPIGACDTCRGFGRTIDIDLDLIIPNPSLSISEGAIKPWVAGRPEHEDLIRFCRKNKIKTDAPFRSLPDSQRKAVIDGTPSYYGIRGFFNWLETKTYKMHVRVFLSRYRSYNICHACNGTRFKPETLLYRLNGLSIADIYSKNVLNTLTFFENLSNLPLDKVGRLLLGEVQNRLRYLCDVGLGYLTLDRQSRTLSGGEVQRVALASALGAYLVNTLYILDEPSIGLHPSDNHRLIRILQSLRDLQNTLVIVEHDPEIIRHSDFMLDVGPQAGEKGGRITYFGPTKNVKDSLTGQYLTGKKQIPIPDNRRRPKKREWVTIEGAEENNLKNIDVQIPLGLFVCLVGVSGSGKSTLAEEILYKAAKRLLNDQGRPGRHKRIRGLSRLSDVLLVDQRAIGRTPRANPLTYTKAMDPIRRLLADTEEAKIQELGPSAFSFNVAGGRCETCKGEGFERVEMQFLSDVFITCPDCGGKRFKKHILRIRYNGKNIRDILTMTVNEALAFFNDHPKIINPLKPLSDVGLGYIRLGQPVNTFSGGEAQRLKLSRHLKSGDGTQKLFIFDEPTTGLHFDDIKKLLNAFQRLVEEGNTLLVIEHNMDIIKSADWVIELGPEGGDAGGQIVTAGSPEDIAVFKNSPTGKFLKPHLKGNAYLTTKKTLKSPGSQTARRNKTISITGAKAHNLKNLSLSIPRNQLVVFTGVSGSGKSTLAFDILFAEGQRRYLESLAPYVRQYVKVLERPEVDLVNGLPPTVAIEQRISHAGRRSTVATLTEIYHFLRLLFSKIGEQHCLGCDRKLTVQSSETIIERIKQRYRKRSASVLAPKIIGRKGFHKDILTKARREGFKKARIDGAITVIREDMALSRYHEHTIELVVGRLPSKHLPTLVTSALKQGNGDLIISAGKGRDEIYSQKGICPTCGIGLETMDPRLFSFNSTYGECSTCKGLGELETEMDGGGSICPACNGSRLRPEALAVKIRGRNIWDMVCLPAAMLQTILGKFKFHASEAPIADPIIAEIMSRLSLLNRLGLSYLSLGRSGETLSGGEAQRVRLAAQLGSNLTGVCYILDEPTIGLHPRDNGLLLDSLITLRDRGNTVLVVEHDEDTIKAADTIIDLGPGAGQSGGRLVAKGGLNDIKKVPESITGAVLNGNRREMTSKLRSIRNGHRISVRGATVNNLKKIDIGFPLGTLICVTGVSGSGKSTLVKETLYKGIRNQLTGQALPFRACKIITGWKKLDRVLEVDHSPIGKTPRSVPASYVGFLSDIRKLFSLTPEARARGYHPGRFSFNLTGGRCEACKGHGSSKVAMSFLPDVYVHCEVCNGLRFNPETLRIRFKGKSMAEVLELTFHEATEFFSAVPPIRRAVQFFCDIGLGYLKLGQPSPTLSGGEAQRIKIAKELVKPSKGRTLYVLDEPSTGLHLSDVQQLIDVLQAIVDNGNTMVVIEHNLEIIKAADYIIDLGPEGGEEGGTVVTQGSPLDIIKNPNGSHTARYLKQYLKNVS